VIYVVILAIQIMQTVPAFFAYDLTSYLGVPTSGFMSGLFGFIVYITAAAGSITGGFLERRFGAKGLFYFVLGFFTLSGALHLLAGTSFGLFMTARALYGIAFGLYVPFLGSAVEGWYRDEQRVIPNTLNSFVIYLGAVLACVITIPVTTLLGGSIEGIFAIWSIVPAVVLFFWHTLFVKVSKAEAKERGLTVNEGETVEKGLYRNLFKRRNILLVNFVWILDYFVFAYLLYFMVTYLTGLFEVSEALVGVLTGAAFFAVGIPATLVSGVIMNKLGRNNGVVQIAQFITGAGFLLAAFGTGSLVAVVLGIMLYGLGNSLWMPQMYQIPTELEDMNPSRVAAAFSIGGVAGFIFAALGPIVGGAITDAFAASGGAVEGAFNADLAGYLYGIKMTFIVCGALKFIAFVVSLFIKETGPKAKWRQSAA
jgi:MFS family permease